MEKLTALNSLLAAFEKTLVKKTNKWIFALNQASPITRDTDNRTGALILDLLRRLPGHSCR